MLTPLPRMFGRLGLLLVLSAVAAPALAVTLDDLLGQLDSDDLITRDTATDELRKRLSDTTDAQTVEAARALEMEAAGALRTHELSLEQRVRLFAALQDRFFGTPRGAMGVQFAQPPRMALGVELGQVFPGFPAVDQGLLKAGDVVTSAGGVPLTGPELVLMGATGMTRASERLRHIVISHDPGETIDMTLVRPIGAKAGAPAVLPNIAAIPGGGELITEGPGKNAEVITVAVPLGAFDQLRQGRFLDQPTLEGAWKQRGERLGIPQTTARTLGTPLTLREWGAHRRVAKQGAPALLVGAEQPGADESVNTALAGGAFPVKEIDMRQVPAPIEARLRAAQLSRARGNEVELRKGAGRAAEGQGVIVRGGENGRVEEITSLLQTVAGLERQRKTLLARASDATVDAKQQRAAAAEASALQGVIENVTLVLRQRLIDNAKTEPKK